MNKKLIIIFFALMMMFALSCKKKWLNNDLCDCGDSQTNINLDTIRLLIPNIFTPNWDGINEEWEIINLEYFQDVEVTIVDEGSVNTIVFHSIGYEKMWDGTHNGKKLKDGKYFYEINFDGHTATGYVCIFTVMDLEHYYWDCLKKCAAMEGMDPLLDY
jgi:gliding motility-associated-like protein